jgi:dihydrofolate synthase/folylpolyglutamate synthase
MSYASAIEHLKAMTPELYTHPGQPRRKFSLGEFGVLLGELGDPQRRVRSVLIAGTNGKGSTAATLASILAASGLRTGLYTSPHLARVNERIRIGEAEIADEDFARLFYYVQAAAKRLVAAGRLPQLPSFFEVLTGIGLLYFAAAKVDVAVLEVGMGGRLDATNIVDPLISVITDISLDHMEWLGSTIAAITREKAGILRRGGTLITLPQLAEANQVLGEVAAELEVRGVNAAAYMPAVGAGAADSYQVDVLGERIEVASPLRGLHQQRNVALAIAAAAELKTAHGFPIMPEAISEGIRQTRWPGRLEHIKKYGVEWILDVAHNPAGAWALCAGLSGLEGKRPRTLIFSCLRDKPMAEMAQILFPLFEQVILAPIQSARAASMAELEAAARATGIVTVRAESVCEALKWAIEREQGGVVAVSGSVYLVGEVRSLLLGGELGGVE